MCTRGKFYEAPKYGEAEQLELGLTCGYIEVNHSAQVMERVADKRGIGDNHVKLYYETTKAAGSTSGKEHVVLIPGTGTTTGIYRRGPRSEHMVGQLIDAGYDVTLFDKRGHGLSSIPKGPYTVELIAADIADALVQLFPGERFHFYGTSLGFGTCMALAIDYPELSKSLSGSGFLFDRTRKDFAAYVFSRPFVIRLFGMRRLARAAEMAMKARNKGILAKEFKYTHIDGYIAAASSWLQFNKKSSLPNHRVPTFILLPEDDEVVGHKRKLYDEEMALMPEGVAQLTYIPGFSHVMLLERTKDGIGSKILGDKYIEFLSEVSRSN